MESTSRTEVLFDEIAADYDQSGVEFFTPIARGLLDQVQPAAGEQVLDIGCGRGAVTVPLARAVGPTGSVRAIDLSANMVAATTRAVDAAGLRNVTATRMDASAPDLGETYDVITSSLVLFFLPEPESALRSWLALLKPGGRIGVTTFGPDDSTWAAIQALFTPFLPPELLDARTSGARGPFASDEGMEALFERCGATDVRTTRNPLAVEYDSAGTWRRFSMSTGMRAMWGLVPAHERDGLNARIGGLLEQARRPGGPIVLTQHIRYTLGSV